MLPVPKLLHEAIHAELRRRRLAAALDVYLSELLAEVGTPSPEETARARALARRLQTRVGSATQV